METIYRALLVWEDPVMGRKTEELGFYVGNSGLMEEFIKKKRGGFSMYESLTLEPIKIERVNEKVIKALANGESKLKKMRIGVKELEKKLHPKNSK